MPSHFASSMSVRSVVTFVLIGAGLLFAYSSLTFDPTTSELATKVTALELQIQQLKASYNSAAPRDSIINLKNHLTELQNRISRHESVLELSKKLSPEHGIDDKQRQVIVESAQREIAILRAEIQELQAAYQDLQAKNALEHANLLDEHKELEQLNQEQHMAHEEEHNKHQQEHEELEQKIGHDVQPKSKGVSLGMDTVLLVICNNRADYLSRTLEAIARYHPKDAVPIVISQDGSDAAVATVIEEFQGKFRTTAPSVPVVHLHHQKNLRSGQDGYYLLTEHYKYGLNTIFNGGAELGSGIPAVKRVIILEEDLEISPDFFEYFAALAPMLDRDTTLLAISAWNDNGMRGNVQDSTVLYRSDFFPGLGWMLTKRLWDELSPKWPNAYWDDWLREPAQRQGRQVIRPEVCRTYHFGNKGTSNAQYSKFLTNIQKNEKFVEFTNLDLSYLDQEKWDKNYIAQVKAAPLVTATAVKDNDHNMNEVRVEYASFSEFELLARTLDIMDNIKAGVPRTAYRGIVSFWKNGCKVHLVPKDL